MFVGSYVERKRAVSRRFTGHPQLPHLRLGTISFTCALHVHRPTHLDNVHRQLSTELLS